MLWHSWCQTTSRCPNLPWEASLLKCSGIPDVKRHRVAQTFHGKRLSLNALVFLMSNEIASFHDYFVLSPLLSYNYDIWQNNSWATTCWGRKSLFVYSIVKPPNARLPVVPICTAFPFPTIKSKHINLLLVTHTTGIYDWCHTLNLLKNDWEKCRSLKPKVRVVVFTHKFETFPGPNVIKNNLGAKYTGLQLEHLFFFSSWNSFIYLNYKEFNDCNCNYPQCSTFVCLFGWLVS